MADLSKIRLRDKPNWPPLPLEMSPSMKKIILAERQAVEEWTRDMERALRVALAEITSLK